MDVVLGLALTPATLRWVLVEGTTGEGAPIDRGALDLDTAFDADRLLRDVVGAAGHRVHAVGVTWSRDVESAAGALLDALYGRESYSVVAISDVEAVDALASGIADIAGYDDVAVCVVECEVAVVAVVDAGGVTVERIDGPDGAAVAACWAGSVRQPQAVFVLGSDDVDLLVASLGERTDVSVISAAEADFAMARGAALASASAVEVLDAPSARRRLRNVSRTGALASVLAAAVVTFVVSVSVAVGMGGGPDEPEQQREVGEVVDAADTSAPPASSRPTTPSKAAETVALTKPPAPEVIPSIPWAAPDSAPAPAVVPTPEPVYVPPPAPAAPAPVPAAPAPVPVYAPPPVPAAPPPPPRLRDRIIEKIPIINRFHTPQYGQ